MGVAQRRLRRSLVARQLRITPGLAAGVGHMG